MNKPITIAVDAMGGDDSPKKIIKGIELFLKNNTDVSFKIFGNETLLFFENKTFSSFVYEF